MIVVLKHGVEAAKREQLIDWLKGQGLTIHISEGEYQTVLGLVGDTTRVDMDLIGSLRPSPSSAATASSTRRTPSSRSAA